MSDMVPTVGVVVKLCLCQISKDSTRKWFFFPATVNAVVEYHKQKVHLMYN